MTTLSSSIKLGQRVYGVTSGGIIEPTLISELLLKHEEDKSSLLETTERHLYGKTHFNSHIAFRSLNNQITMVFIGFDEALEQATTIVEQKQKDDSISVADSRAYDDLLRKYTQKPDLVRVEVDAVELFSKTKSFIDFIFKDDDKEEYWKSSDFPKHYHPPGTPVWVADTEKYQLIQGFVTRVFFAPNWKRKHLYECGSNSNIRADTLFKTKRGALNFLAREFAKNLPGTLDRNQVKIVRQISKSEEHEKTLKRFRKMKLPKIYE